MAKTNFSEVSTSKITIEAQPGGVAAGTSSLGAVSATSVTLGSRGTVTQITSATTGVTVNASSGAITTVVQNIAAGGEVQFTVTNSSVAANDVPVVSIASGSTGGTTVANVTAVAAGSFQITLTNLHAATAETGTLVINFAVVKSA